MKKIALALCVALSLVSHADAVEEKKSSCITYIPRVHVSIDNQFDQDLLLTTLKEDLFRFDPFNRGDGYTSELVLAVPAKHTREGYVSVVSKDLLLTSYIKLTSTHHYNEKYHDDIRVEMFSDPETCEVSFSGCHSRMKNSDCEVSFIPHGPNHAADVKVRIKVWPR